MTQVIMMCMWLFIVNSNKNALRKNLMTCYLTIMLIIWTLRSFIMLLDDDLNIRIGGFIALGLSIWTGILLFTR